MSRVILGVQAARVSLVYVDEVWSRVEFVELDAHKLQDIGQDVAPFRILHNTENFVCSRPVDKIESPTGLDAHRESSGNNMFDTVAKPVG